MGGIVAVNIETIISECWNKADLSRSENKSSTTTSYIGGIASSLMKGEINYCYNMGAIDGAVERIGGIIASLTRGSEVNNCYNKGALKGKEGAFYAEQCFIGGISPDSWYDENYSKKDCIIRNGYNLESVLCENTAEYRCIGGIMGGNANGHFEIKNSYNQANISATKTGANVGGIIGLVDNFEQIKITDCTTTMTTAIGVNRATTANATITNVLGGQTNLPSVLSVVNTDREGVFIEDSQNTNNGYPILKWQMEHFNRNQ